MLLQFNPVAFQGNSKVSNKNMKNQDSSMPAARVALDRLKERKREIYENGWFKPVVMYFEIEGTKNLGKISISPDPEFPKTKRMIMLGAVREGEDKVTESFYKTDLSTKEVYNWLDSADVDEISERVRRHSEEVDKARR